MCCGLFLAVPAAVTAFIAGYFCPRQDALLYGAGQMLQLGADALGPLAQPLAYAASGYAVSCSKPALMLLRFGCCPSTPCVITQHCMPQVRCSCQLDGLDGLFKLLWHGLLQMSPSKHVTCTASTV
jgi:hypothetical protein